MPYKRMTLKTWSLPPMGVMQKMHKEMPVENAPQFPMGGKLVISSGISLFRTTLGSSYTGAFFVSVDPSVDICSMFPMLGCA